MKKEISDFMQSQSVAKEMTETDAAMVSSSSSSRRKSFSTRVKKYYKKDPFIAVYTGIYSKNEFL